jgi:hypothetical protein
MHTLCYNENKLGVTSVLLRLHICATVSGYGRKPNVVNDIGRVKAVKLRH